MLRLGSASCRMPLAVVLVGIGFLLVGTTTAVDDEGGPEAPSSPTVIGYFDSGINPYHEEFRAPGWTDHPSTYIEGYPESAEPIDLTLDAETFEEAWQADHNEWNSLGTDQLYYIPGTRIVGVIDDNIEFRESPAPTYDRHGHGTLVASAGSGRTLGTAPSSAIAMAAGGMRPDWMVEQPWIDVVSSSIGDLAGAGTPQEALATYELADQGRSLFAGGGNDPIVAGPTTLTASYAGPPWTVTVGLYMENPNTVPTGQFCTGCHVPAEVLGTTDVPVAATDSLNDTRRGTGTSTASPRVAGHAAMLIDRARERLDDVSRPGLEDVDVFARASPDTEVPESGPLADGAFDRTELEDLIRQSARPEPWAMPPWDKTPDRLAQPAEARYTWQGYGVHDDDANDRAEAILLGEQPWPHRPTDDRWHDFWNGAAGAYWATLLCHNTGFRQSFDGNCWVDPTRRFAEASSALVEGVAK